MEKIIIKKDEMTLEIPVPEAVEKADIFTTASKIEKFVRLFNPETIVLSQGIRRDRIIWEQLHAAGLEVIPATDYCNSASSSVFALNPSILDKFSLDGDDVFETCVYNFGVLTKLLGRKIVAVPPTLVTHCIIARAFA